jgi:hypothetical protein
MNKSNPTWRRRTDIAETPVEDDIFLVVPETEAIFHLNAVGTALWRLLAEPRSRDDLVSLLSAAFPDAPSTAIASDVDAFLTNLNLGGLIAHQTAGTPGQGLSNPLTRRS